MYDRNLIIKPSAELQLFALYEFQNMPSPFPELENNLDRDGYFNFDKNYYFDYTYNNNKSKEEVKDVYKDYFLGKVSFFHHVLYTEFNIRILVATIG